MHRIRSVWLYPEADDETSAATPTRPATDMVSTVAADGTAREKSAGLAGGCRRTMHGKGRGGSEMARKGRHAERGKDCHNTQNTGIEECIIGGYSGDRNNIKKKVDKTRTSVRRHSDGEWAASKNNMAQQTEQPGDDMDDKPDIISEHDKAQRREDLGLKTSAHASQVLPGPRMQQAAAPQVAPEVQATPSYSDDQEAMQDAPPPAPPNWWGGAWMSTENEMGAPLLKVEKLSETRCARPSRSCPTSAS